MRRSIIAIASFLLLLIAPGLPGFAQSRYRGSNTALYRELARRMANDGFAQRQAGYTAKITKESMEENRLGFAAYRKKDYAQAVLHFEKALVLDKANMFAHFNAACALSLAYGSSGLGERPNADPAVFKSVVDHLQRAAERDVHWIYKVFLDTDLDPVRFALIRFTAYFPCPGDCCPDQYYYLRTNGTAGYAAAAPDLSGMGDPPDPDPAVEGWYTQIGDYVLAYIPGSQGLVRSMFPSAFADVEEAGGDAAPADFLECLVFERDAAGKITSVNRN